LPHIGRYGRETVDMALLTPICYYYYSTTASTIPLIIVMKRLRGSMCPLLTQRPWVPSSSLLLLLLFQSLVIRVYAGPVLASPWNNFVLCVEMVFFSLFLGAAFSYKEYMTGIPDVRVLQNIGEVLSVR